MEKRFLRSYMELLVQTCHRRGALATGGMAALLLPEDRDAHRTAMAAVSRLKLMEIQAGVDGFMVYDLGLIEPMQKPFKALYKHRSSEMTCVFSPYSTSCSYSSSTLKVITSSTSFWKMEVTLYGLKYNIAVGVLFINAWLSGKGHFFYRGQVEDSATAEISRSQVWQWIRHQTQLEDDSRVVSRRLVTDLSKELVMELLMDLGTGRHSDRLLTAADMFLEVVLKRDFPEFITTYLNQDHTFLSSQNTGQVEAIGGEIPRPKL
ncbi:hypothetical protein F7725_009559 [Dissostichus mawsoni]|uniref:malate synthase n=1 Tax=Dissostichus mawsoni TaxID=36200 RepID=A0A7J5XLF5_DISMA|nr:hypothetical protein F7725_009559 [Dissostichus mawsoni]